MKNYYAFTLLCTAIFLIGTYTNLLSQSSKDTTDTGKTPAPVSTQHQISIGGESYNYTATTGYMPLKSEDGTLKARIFFIAYTLNGVENTQERPITFSFNGGPGSSSVWLHMGALGPKRVMMTEKGETLPPPYQYEDNPYSWLDKTDLVFIDPVMTGYSRPAKGVKKSEFTGYTEDIASVGEFIRLYTSQHSRWASPKFLAGESYGTTRSAGLSDFLQTRYGLYLNGIVLISAITNFQTARFDRGNDMPYLLFLPTYAAISRYHGQLPQEKEDMEAFMDEVRSFVLNEYSVALMKGAQLTDNEKNEIAEKLYQYTGLSKEYLTRSLLRINIRRYVKELMREEGKTVGRLDGRFTGTDFDDAGEQYEFDPSYNKTIYGAYTSAINDYVRQDLNYKNDLPYEILTSRVRPWSYKNVENQYLNVSESLRKALNKNPYMQILVCNGYYDLATPFFATEYTMDHMFLSDDLKDNIKMKYYEAGHMMYIHQPSLEQMKKDIDTFYQQSVQQEVISY